MKYDPNAWERLGDEFTNNYEQGMLDYRANIVRTIFLYEEQCENLLEIACADGWFIEKLRKAGFKNKYEGIDITQNLLIRAKARIASENFWMMDATKELIYTDKNFDFVLCAGLLMHLDEDGFRRAIDEACRVSNKFVMFSLYGTYKKEKYQVPDPKFLNNVYPMSDVANCISDEFKLIEFNSFPRSKYYNMFQFLYMRGDLP